MTFALLLSCTTCTVAVSASARRRFAYPVGERSTREAADALLAELRAAPNADGHRFDVAEIRADGWPLCPFCGEDELYSLSLPATRETIAGCYRCGTDAVAAADRREGQR